jgi:hypothetical protein
MMRHLLLLALVACKSAGTGVDIEVVPPPGTAEVELLVAPERCSDSLGSACAVGIGWPPLKGPQPTPPGTIYSLDNDMRNVIPVTRDGDKVRFRLEPGDSGEVERLAVIAFDGAGSASAFSELDHVTIPTTPPEIWQVDLATIDPIGMMLGPPTNASPTDLVQVWRPPMRPDGGTEDPSTFASCFARQTWDASQLTWNREFLAPTSDPDCDNESIECNPYWYDYATGTGGTACLTPTSSFAPTCVIGGSACADGQSSTTRCALPVGNLMAICVPDALCACMDPGSLSQCVGGVVDGTITVTTPLTSVECNMFPINKAANSGPCNSNNANQVTVTLPLANASHMSIGLLAVPFGTPLATDQGTFMVGTAGFTMHANLTLGTIQLTWETGTAPIKVPDLMIDVAFTTEHVLIPLKIGFNPALLCPPQTITLTCSPGGKGSGDNMFRCNG